MPKLPTLSEVLAASGASRDDFNNWYRRKFLGSHVPETTPGVARTMTRSVALQIAFMAALTDVGFDTEDASMRARTFAEFVGARNPKQWFIFDPVTGNELLFGDKGAESSIASLLEMFAEGEGELVDSPDATEQIIPTTRLRIVHIGGIVSRIDRLFGK